MDVHYSSATDDWATPDDFFQKLHREFRFQTDVCASESNAKCAKFYTKESDGLSQEWSGACWMNPPYGREIGRWMEKAYQSARQNGATVVALVPARTDTRWWHSFATKGEVFFVPGRLKFGNAKANAPFPCAVVVFRPSVAMALAVPSRDEVTA